MGKLTAKGVEALKLPGRYGDGDGLYLDIAPGGARSWIVRVQFNGKRRDIGLGGLTAVPLARARAMAVFIRQQAKAGIDPVAERKQAAIKANMPTFAAAARLCHAENEATWRNAKHGKQWLQSLETYAFPKIGNMMVDSVDAPAVRDVLAPIWLKIPETARRVRQRIGTVLDWAHGKGYRTAPLAVNGIARSLPRQPKQDGHFEAMPWADVPQFVRNLHGSNRGSEACKLALEFLILTAARSGEVRGLTWNEIDEAAKVWTVPAARMKGKRQHTVPLGARTLAIIARMKELRVGDSQLVFPGRRKDRPMSDMTLKMALRRLNLSADPHGFRSSFRDWVSEATSYPEAVAEAALAHIRGDKTEAAYARSDLLEKRRSMMADWATHIGG